MNPLAKPSVRSAALLALLAGAALAHAGTVQAPPRPPGSQLVRVDPGANPEERRRNVRAHNHGHQKRDPKRDDSRDQSAQPRDDDAKPNKKN